MPHATVHGFSPLHYEVRPTIPQNRASMTCMLYYESFNVLGLAGWGDIENHCKLLLVWCLSCPSPFST